MSADTTRARMLLELGRAAEARELLARELAAAPDSFEALALLAHASYVLGDHEAQREAAERLITLDPEEELGHRLRALACTHLDRHVEAVRDAREAVRLDPLEYRTHLVLSSALRNLSNGPLRQAMLDEAWQAAMRAADLAPDQADTHLEAGMVAFHQREYGVSEQALRRALDLDPEHVAAMNMLGILRLRDAKEHRAGELFRAALNADPSGEPARHGMAGIAWLLLRRTLIVTSCALVLVLPMLRADSAAALRAAVACLLVLTAAAMLGRSLQRLEPAVRHWVVRAAWRVRSVTARAATTLAALTATVVAGLVPGSYGAPATITAVLAVAVAWWVDLVF